MYKNMPMPKPFSAEIVYFCNMSIVRAKKSLGQHFLRDQNIARKITDSLLPVTRDILEIGPGMGVLTRHLFANPAFSVRAIDIDQESIDYLHQELSLDVFVTLRKNNPSPFGGYLDCGTYQIISPQNDNRHNRLSIRLWLPRKSFSAPRLTRVNLPRNCPEFLFR